MRNQYGFSVFLLLVAIFCEPSAQARPRDQGHGQVHVRGSVIETPCAIDTPSRDQTVDMGATPTTVITRDGQGAARPFSIRLVNCHLARLSSALPDWRYFRATFDGPDDSGLFGLDGDARGVALQVTDNQGRVARPGEPLQPGVFGLSADGVQQLDYSLRLVSNGELPRAGDFRTALRFRIDYY